LRLASTPAAGPFLANILPTFNRVVPPPDDISPSDRLPFCDFMMSSLGRNLFVFN
jgi:hypothetical protein